MTETTYTPRRDHTHDWHYEDTTAADEDRQARAADPAPHYPHIQSTPDVWTQR